VVSVLNPTDVVGDGAGDSIDLSSWGLGMPIRLVVVDGHTLIRYGIRELVAEQPDMEIVAECGTAAEAPQVLGAFRPDVVTIAVTLPDGDGLQLARELRDRRADLGIVILTSKDRDDVLFRALENGVSAFVAKTAPVQELLAGIRHSSVAAASFTAAGLALALSRRTTARHQLGLSSRETEVLGLLHAGLSIPAIAAAMYISQSTAKTYVSRLYDKLGVASRAQALMTAMHYGLIQFDHDSPGRIAAATPHRATAAIEAHIAASLVPTGPWRGAGPGAEKSAQTGCALASC
jgi:DNA-binding NarL/FixJ family response regulator